LAQNTALFYFSLQPTFLIKNPMKKLLALSFCFFATVAIQILPVSAQTPANEGLGLRPPTLLEKAEEARTMVRTRKVLPNKLALDRLNSDRTL
jgi:hypothetical protein